jgi:subtilisin family serine protease
MPANQGIPTEIAKVAPPRQFDSPQLGFTLAEVDRLIRANEARNVFGVDGGGLTAAVLDTGLNTQHVDFAGRVIAQKNFTSDNGSDPNNAKDGNGHGTNVGGIIVANGDHRGVARGANIIPLKVLSNNGSGSFAAVDQALEWVIDHRDEHSIAVVCMSLGDSSNRLSDDGLASDPIRQRIEQLRQANVAVVIASGNDFFPHQSAQGMAYPAIIRQCVSVGAVFDEFEGAFNYASGAKAFSSAPDRITPFSQRLHPTANQDCRTDIFAPGALVTSAGINGPNGESIQQGTSQAAPVVAGVILLMQHLHQGLTGRLAAVDDVVARIRESAVTINDGDDEADNVTHTNLDFLRVDAFRALDALARGLQKELLLTGQPIRAAGSQSVG